MHSSKSASDIRRGQEFVDGDTVGLLLDTDARTLTVYREGTAVARLQDDGLSAPLCFMSELCCGPHHPQTHDSGCAYTEGTVSGHDIAGIWVAFFQECQQYRCGQVRINWAPPPIEEGEAEKKNTKPDKAKVNTTACVAHGLYRRAAFSHRRRCCCSTRTRTAMKRTTRRR